MILTLSIFDQSIYGSVVWMRCPHRLDQTSLFASTASSSLGSRLNWTAVVEFNSTHFLFFSLSLSAFQLIERITTSEMHTAPSKLFRNFWLQLQLISIWFTMRSLDNVAFHLLFLRQHMHICTHSWIGNECRICGGGGGSGDGNGTSNTHPFEHSNRIALFSFIFRAFFAKLAANLEYDSAYRKFWFYSMHTNLSYRAQ